MQKRETRMIDGLEIAVTQLPPMRAVPLSIEVGKVLLPVLVASGGDLRGAMKMGRREVQAAFYQAFTALSGGKAVELIRALFESAHAIVDGKQVPLNNDRQIDLVFLGRNRALFDAAFFAVEVNFADFFPDAGPEENDETDPSKTKEAAGE